MAEDTHQGVEWSPGETPRPVSVAVVQHGPTDNERIRDLEEGQRKHDTMLQDHSKVLESINEHLEKLSEQVGKFSTRFIVAVIVIFGGTQNGEEIAKLVASLST